MKSEAELIHMDTAFKDTRSVPVHHADFHLFIISLILTPVFALLQ